MLLANLLHSCAVSKGKISEGCLVDSYSLLDNPVYTKSTHIETIDEAKKRLEIEVLRREKLRKSETRDKKRRIFLVMAYISFFIAIVGVLYGAFTKGWKMGASVAMCGIGLGMVFLSLIGLMPYITWLVGILIAFIIARVLYTIREKGVI